ncbi:cyclophilin-like domain-containing protein [Paraphysoderma sedebokerense]|nr:cyclophilin-like domain-containing protein [Paraphysoderma sedebokerense]
MSVLIETSLGDIVIDLFTDLAPQTCLNFLKLCKIKYYNFNLFFNVQKDFMAQTGDPTGTGKGGESVFGYGVIHGPSRRYFPSEIHPKLKHKKKGTVSMAVAPLQEAAVEGLQGVSGSQFLITTADDLDYLDGKYTVFGEVAEGFEVLDTINESFVDEVGRPLKDIRIKHTIVLDDPFPDPEGLIVPDKSPEPTKEMLESIRIAEDESIEPELPPEEMEKELKKREAQANALTLEMIGDLPFAEIKPPENVLFVCKLNPVTTDEDLELIFSRFGKINSCEIIRDKQTGESLCYSFIEFDERDACEEAYFKMQSVLIDDRRIHVDFSQSVSKLHKDWIVARKKQQGGYGGFAGMKKRGRYREEEDNDTDDYRLVFEHGEGGKKYMEGREGRVQNADRARESGDARRKVTDELQREGRFGERRRDDWKADKPRDHWSGRGDGRRPVDREKDRERDRDHDRHKDRRRRRSRSRSPGRSRGKW